MESKYISRITYVRIHSSLDSANSDRETEDLFGQYFVDRRLGQKNQKRWLKCWYTKKQSSIRNNIVMKCFVCGYIRLVAFDRECPDHTERVKKRSGIQEGFANS